MNDVSGGSSLPGGVIFFPPLGRFSLSLSLARALIFLSSSSPEREKTGAKDSKTLN